MRISVIIATYNRCESLKETLKSLLAQVQDGSFDYEVIVVDNNSSDKTKEAVRSYSERFKGRLKYLFESKQGKSFALNLGIESASADILAFTDDDCLPAEDWLNAIVRVFKERDVDLLGGKIIPFFTTPIPKWLDFTVLKGPTVYYHPSEEYIDNTEKKGIYPTGANFALRKSSYFKYGPFTSHVRGQDTLLAKQWESQGAVIGYDPGVIVSHYTHPHRMTKNFFRRWYYVCGFERGATFKEKYGGGKTIFNVSVWVYKELFDLFKKALIVVSKGKDAFSVEVWIWYYLGVISRLNRVNFNTGSFR